MKIQPNSDIAPTIKVSVITPIYNRLQFVPTVVAQLKVQTLSEIEFIIVDDCSTDGTADELRRLTQGDHRFRFLYAPENQGPSACRNRALQAARGEYIGFFDSDDEIPSDYFADLYRQATSSSVTANGAIAECGSLPVQRQFSADIVFASSGNRPQILSTREEKLNALRNGAVWNKLYRANFLRQNDITFAEGLLTADNLFNIRTFSATGKVLLTDYPQYKYALKSDSIGADGVNLQKMRRRQHDIFTVCRLALKFAEEQNFSPPEIAALRSFLQRTYACYPQDRLFQKHLQQFTGRVNTLKPEKGRIMTTGLLKTMRLLHIINKEKYNEKRQIEIVKNSPLFNAKWYLAQNPDVRNRKIGAAKHYVKLGWKEGRNPSPEFDGNAYLAEYDDVAAVGICPLVHYLINGRKEGRMYRGTGKNGTVANSGVFGELWAKAANLLAYPLRVKEECDRLRAEIKELQIQK